MDWEKVGDVVELLELLYSTSTSCLTTDDSGMDNLVAKVQEISKTVYSVLGPGHDESVYRLAMSIELREAQIPFKQEQSVDVLYRVTPPFFVTKPSGHGLPRCSRIRHHKSDALYLDTLQLPGRWRPALPVAHGISLIKAHSHGSTHRNRKLRVLADELSTEPFGYPVRHVWSQSTRDHSIPEPPLLVLETANHR